MLQVNIAMNDINLVKSFFFSKLIIEIAFYLFSFIYNKTVQ